MKSFRFPWYDSNWLTSYLRAKEHIARHYPDRLAHFIDAFAVLRVDPGFQLHVVNDVFDDGIRSRLRQAVALLQDGELERHEFFSFGRLLVHDHPVLTELQDELALRVGDLVGEEVEACYNFLNLYTNLGVCPPHMDSPVAKWTFDYCIEQSAPWPIHFSQVVPWPEEWRDGGADWGERIKQDPANRFTTYVMQENQALLFAGSSQWHYRERIEQKYRRNYSHQAFFHYIPKGTRELVMPQYWARLFGIPQLQDLVIQETDNRLAVSA
ncbi:MAG TPA: hypothetical protein VMH83_00170 [Candidatus Acidoferrum sp.]|nr:hypothetical protein [Candidatus Acidoferrum sp.]